MALKLNPSNALWFSVLAPVVVYYLFFALDCILPSIGILVAYLLIILMFVNNILTFVIIRFSIVEPHFKNLAFNAFTNLPFLLEVVYSLLVHFHNAPSYSNFIFFTYMLTVRLIYQSAGAILSKNVQFVKEQFIDAFSSRSVFAYYSALYLLPGIEFIAEALFKPEFKCTQQDFEIPCRFEAVSRIAMIVSLLLHLLFMIVLFLRNQNWSHQLVQPSTLRKAYSIISLLVHISLQIVLLNPISLAVSVVAWAVYKPATIQSTEVAETLALLNQTINQLNQEIEVRQQQLLAAQQQQQQTASLIDLPTYLATVD